jgi:hypothetical protein
MDNLFRAGLLLLLILFSRSEIFSTISLDHEFGNGGKVVLTFPPTGGPEPNYYTSICTKIFAQPGNRIVGVGWFQNWGLDGPSQGLALAGLNQNGTLDMSFGDQGIFREWQFCCSRILKDAYMYPNGKILRLWDSWGASSTFGAILARINSDGSADPSFAADLTTPLGPATPVKMSMGSDGKIAVVVYKQNR